MDTKRKFEVFHAAPDEHIVREVTPGNPPVAIKAFADAGLADNLAYTLNNLPQTEEDVP